MGLQKTKPLTTFRNNKLNEVYKIFNRKIIIENIKTRKQINKFTNKSVSAILDGKLINNNKQTALNYGEIIKTSSLKILMKEFTIHKNLLILNVS